jgi:HNH endonuclease/AP2 domain
MIVLMNNCCVYTHSDPSGVIKYVGSGSLSRAFRNNATSNRGIKYKDYVEKFGRLIVKIVKKDLSKFDAIELEIKLYNENINNDLLNVSKPVHVNVLPTKEELDKILYYDENVESCLRWISGNKRNTKDGSIAGNLSKSSGYWSVNINNKLYRCHRIVAVLHGLDVTQDKVVDHIDTNKSNNKIDNLRVVTQSENSRNRNVIVKDKELPVGVSFDSVMNRFVASVTDHTIQTKSGQNKRLHKYFAVEKYGYNEALRLAIATRKEMLCSLENKYNVQYSKLHK